MADEEKPEDAPAEGEDSQGEGKPKKNRGPLKLLIGVILLVATGGVLATMAVPKKEKEYKLTGPYFARLLDKDIVVSTPDGNATRYLKFRVDCEYAAYEEPYFATRAADPFFLPYLNAEAQTIASSRTLSESALGAEREEFAAALRDGLEPIVFPVHVGETLNPLDADAPSGLRPGVSHHQATFRGRFHEWTLTVDGPARTVQLGEGTVVTFEGDEDDLEVRSQLGDTIYIDVTHLVPEFQGELKVGVHGKLRNVLLEAIGQ